MRLLMYGVFGSHLYGTDTPESDRDFKGVYLPDVKDILMGVKPKSLRLDKKQSNTVKNGAEDVDIELIDLRNFMKYLVAGDTTAIDMIHTNEKNLLYTSPTWEYLQSNRSKFISRNMKAFTGYAFKQAAKYGMKGSRLEVCERILKILKTADPDTKLTELWDQLPISGYSKPIQDSKAGVKQYEVCGKVLQETMSASYASAILDLYVEKYGQRARDARENKGVDWKAISHAFRACFQLQELYLTGDLKYPLLRANYLRDLKTGFFTNYSVDVIEALGRFVRNLHGLAEYSKQYPSSIDPELWESFTFSTIFDYVNGSTDPEYMSFENLRNLVYDLSKV